MPNRLTVNDLITINLCQTTCLQNNYLYAGVQAGYRFYNRFFKDLKTMRRALKIELKKKVPNVIAPIRLVHMDFLKIVI